MRFFVTIFCLFMFSTLTFSQPGLYKGNFEAWEEEAKTNNKLLPRYGHQPRTPREKKADSIFINDIMQLPQFKTRREASDHMIKLGFDYYGRDDLHIAMARFNQAYLLDSTNSNDYWGYGAVYMRYGMLGLAADQYLAGLAIDSMNTNLWTDYATVLLAQYYRLDYEPGLDSAIIYLNRSYSIDPKNVNTVYKLSVCHLNKKNCSEARRYYDECINLGGKPITDAFRKDMDRICKKRE